MFLSTPTEYVPIPSATICLPCFVSLSTVLRCSPFGFPLCSRLPSSHTHIFPHSPSLSMTRGTTYSKPKGCVVGQHFSCRFCCSCHSCRPYRLCLSFCFRLPHSPNQRHRHCSPRSPYELLAIRLFPYCRIALLCTF